MPQLSDVRFAALRALGFTGSTSDMLLAWLQTFPFGGAPTLPNKTVPDAWKAALSVVPPSIGPTLVQNGTFDTDTAGWTAVGGTFVSTSGEAILTNQAASFGRASQAFPTVAGKKYLVEGNFRRVDVNGILRASTVPDGSELLSAGLTSTQSFSHIITATAATTYVSLWNNSTVGGNSSGWDNIVITELQDIDNYQRNDWWYEYLGSLGYTGQLNDRELAYWLQVFQDATGGAYSAAYSTAFD